MGHEDKSLPESGQRRAAAVVGDWWIDGGPLPIFGGWKSVWCGVPNFDLPALVRLARFAGVHLYADAPVVLNADNRMMMIHNGYGATRTVHISLPREAKVSELFSGETIADGKEFDVSLAAPDTKLLKLEYCW